MTKKSTKRSLAMSILSMVLCLAMLIGSTYAWFSDKAETGEVTITAGNLDVEIVDDQATSAEDGTPVTDLFTEEKANFKNNWEPGKMVVSDAFKIANKGSLDLYYTVNLIENEGESEAANLLDVVKAKVVDSTKFTVEPDATYDQRVEAWEGIKDDSNLTSGHVAAGKVSENALVLVLFWKADPSTSTDKKVNKDNNFNIQEGGPLTANFKVEVFATQYESESDSFGNKYDAGAAQQLAVKTSWDNGMKALSSNKDVADAAKITITSEGGVEKANVKFSSDKFASGQSNPSDEQKTAMTNAFRETLDAIGNALLAQKANIKSLKITAGGQPGSLEMQDVTEDQIKGKLLGAAMAAITVSDFASNAKIEVEVTTADGSVVPYEITLVFDGTNINSTTIVEYAKAALKDSDVIRWYKAANGQ